MLRLKTLKVKNCRGLIDGPELNFETGGLLLCGSNGTGKSELPPIRWTENRHV